MCCGKELPERGMLWRWKDRVKEYMCERGATRRGRSEQARRECLDEGEGLSKQGGSAWMKER